MVQDLFVADDEGIVLRVHAQPGAGRSGVNGRHGDALRVRVAAPPEGGRANEALRTVLAGVFGVAPSAVTLVGGASSRSKRFRVAGVEAGEAEACLQRALEGGGGGGPGTGWRDARRR